MEDIVSLDSTEPVPTRELQRRMTRRRIVAAARRVFEQHGYAGATIGDMAKASGVNRATFYLHFTNKPDVFIEVYDDVRNQQSAHYWAMLGDTLEEGTATALRKFLHEALGWWEDNAALLPAIHEAMASDLQVAVRWKDQIDQLAEQLQGYLSGFPEERRAQQRLRVELLVVQLDEICFRAIVQKVFSIPKDDLVELVTSLWVDALHLAAD